MIVCKIVQHFLNQFNGFYLHISARISKSRHIFIYVLTRVSRFHGLVNGGLQRLSSNSMADHSVVTQECGTRYVEEEEAEDGERRRRRRRRRRGRIARDTPRERLVRKKRWHRLTWDALVRFKCNYHWRN